MKVAIIYNETFHGWDICFGSLESHIRSVLKAAGFDFRKQILWRDDLLRDARVYRQEA
jgi:hypothetical protein